MFYYRNSMPNISSSIRFLHASTEDYNIDIKIDDKLLQTNLSFGTITNYQKISPGEHSIKVYRTDDKSSPVYEDTLVLLPASMVTVSLVTVNNALSVFMLRDGAKTTNPALGNLRFINLSPKSPLFNLLYEDRKPIFENVEFLETTNYTPLEPKKYNFIMTYSDSGKNTESSIRDIDIKKFLSYTIYVIGEVNGPKRLGYIFTTDEIDKWSEIIV